MSDPVIHPSTLRFLKQLKANNNRAWFQLHKPDYERAKENVEQFVDGLIVKMNQHDQLENTSGKKSLYRIYNDVRFSNDKTPYAARFSGYLKRTKPHLRGGYYFWIKPGGSSIGCGFAYPNPVDLLRVRQDIDQNYKEWNKLLRSKSIRNVFGSMEGEQVKTAPRGFAVDHPAIGLLRYKQYWFEHAFSDKDVISPDFCNHMNRCFKSIRPFFDYMTDVLTTDLNGESIL